MFCIYFICILIEILLSPILSEHMGTGMNVGTTLFDTKDEGIPIKLYLKKLKIKNIIEISVNQQ